MPQAIPKGLTREHVLLALADLESGGTHPFDEPTGYELWHQGKPYAPKAVIGLAFRHLTGSILPPEAFIGSEAPGQANHVLRELGFAIEKKGEPEEESDRGPAWSPDEVRLIVADYFDMLRLDLSKSPYGKKAHNDTLREQLNARSKSSVEFKHQNISAALLEMGLSYIDGYKPAKNYQKRLLPQVIVEYLENHPELMSELEHSPVLNPQGVPALVQADIGGYFENPPDRIVIPTADAKPWLPRKGRKVDYVRRDAMNRALGRSGEEFSLELEKRRLLFAGRDDLAAKVEWVAQTCGDGIGYDILSFDAVDEGELYLEVKTTGQGKYFHFSSPKTSGGVRKTWRSGSASTGCSTSPGSRGSTSCVDRFRERARWRRWLGGRGWEWAAIYPESDRNPEMCRHISKSTPNKL